MITPFAFYFGEAKFAKLQKGNGYLKVGRALAVETKDKLLIANADALRAMPFRAQKRWKESVEFFEKILQEFEALNARRRDVYWFAKMVLYECAKVTSKETKKITEKKPTTYSTKP